jgi:predicted O-methyltransferase YrrM
VTSEPTAPDPAALRAYLEGYLVEDNVLASARARGMELGCLPIGAASGAALRFVATVLRARAVVEIGTGTGVSGLYLLRGMAPDGVLTSIDVEPEHHDAAKWAFAAAGVAATRTRLIIGRAHEVLSRLTDGAYDLLFVGAAHAEYPSYHQQGVRLLRPGGVIAFDNVLRSGRVVDPAQRDAETVALRELTRAVHQDDRLVPVLLPIGDGLLVGATLT